MPADGERWCRWVPDGPIPSETRKWIRLGLGRLLPRAERTPANAVLLGDVSLMFEERNGDCGPEAVCEVEIRPSRVFTWLSEAPVARWHRAFLTLAEGWPWGKGSRAVVGSYKTAHRIFLCPPPGVKGQTQGMAAVATALHALAVQGVSLNEALEQARNRPDPLLLAADKRQETAKSETLCLRLGRLEPRAGLEWARSHVLYRLWRDGERMAGFVIRVGLPAYALATTYIGRGPDGASQPWFVPFLIRGQSHVRGAAGVRLLLAAAAWSGAKSRCPQAFRVVRAWPDGEKALLVPKADLTGWPSPYGPRVAVGLRFGSASMEQVEVLFDTALRHAEKGAGEEELRAWLESLDARDVEALGALRELATV